MKRNTLIQKIAMVAQCVNRDGAMGRGKVGGWRQRVDIYMTCGS